MRRLLDAWQLTPAQMSPFNKPLPEEELYDIVADPHELMNLTGPFNERYARTLEQMRSELDRWKRDTNDATPAARTPDEFDRETGEPNANRKRPRLPPKK